MLTKQHQQAILRAKAKKFKRSIPIGLAIPLPDKLIDSISDEDIRYFLDFLKQLNLQQQVNGYWERKY